MLHKSENRKGLLLQARHQIVSARSATYSLPTHHTPAEMRRGWEWAWIGKPVLVRKSCSQITPGACSFGERKRRNRQSAPCWEIYSFKTPDTYQKLPLSHKGNHSPPKQCTSKPEKEHHYLPPPPFSFSPPLFFFCNTALCITYI